MLEFEVSGLLGVEGRVLLCDSLRLKRGTWRPGFAG